MLEKIEKLYKLNNDGAGFRKVSPWYYTAKKQSELECSDSKCINNIIDKDGIVIFDICGLAFSAKSFAYYFLSSIENSKYIENFSENVSAKNFIEEIQAVCLAILKE